MSNSNKEQSKEQVIVTLSKAPYTRIAYDEQGQVIADLILGSRPVNKDDFADSKTLYATVAKKGKNKGQIEYFAILSEYDAFTPENNRLSKAEIEQNAKSQAYDDMLAMIAKGMSKEQIEQAIKAKQ